MHNNGQRKIKCSDGIFWLDKFKLLRKTKLQCIATSIYMAHYLFCFSFMAEFIQKLQPNKQNYVVPSTIRVLNSRQGQVKMVSSVTAEGI